MISSIGIVVVVVSIDVVRVRVLVAAGVFVVAVVIVTVFESLRHICSHSFYFDYPVFGSLCAGNRQHEILRHQARLPEQ